MSYSIIFENVTKHYKSYHELKGGIKNFIVNFFKFRKKVDIHEILKNVTFTIKEGESVAIVGKNGAGKSTVLKLICGIEKPTSGYIKTKGKILPILELGSGFHPDLTGKENIILNAVLLGLRRKEVLLYIKDIIEFSGLGEFIEEPIRTYSTGMLARLGFSIVSHIPGDIILIDEVLAVGDIEFQKKCIDRMLELKKSGKTIVLVSHNISDIYTICDRAIWLKNKSVYIDGSVDRVISSYQKEE